MVQVTRHGFTTCPGCFAHIRVGTVAADTVCPFCEVPLGEELSGEPRVFSGLQRVMRAGRSGLIAATVLGLSAAPACVPSGNAPTGDTVVKEAGTDLGVQPAYGQPADIPIQPPYGVPADVEPPPEDAGPSDVGPAPPYGIPADANP